MNNNSKEFGVMEIPPSLINEHYDDRYFDVVNAVEEAKQVFFQGNRLIETLSAMGEGKKEIRIGETGFGAGRNLVALMDFFEQNNIRDLSVTYSSVELHPITAERMAAILACFRPQVGPLIDLLVTAYSNIDIARPGWHQLQLSRPFGTVTLNLWVGEALEMVHALTMPCDAWFLDGHGPKKNPAIWRPDLLMAVGEKTVANGTCATFTVAGAVRRALGEAGFTVEQCPGCGGKKAVLRGIKQR